MIKKAVLIIILLIAVVLIFIYYVRHEPMNITKNVEVDSSEQPGDVTLINEFDMPERLIEISGLVYLEEDLFAAIQDENGTIFIYKTDNESIEQEIKFGNDGDYEDIAIVDKDAYVLKSDGTLYEIKNYREDGFEVTTFDGIKAKKPDFEGLCYDKKRNRLLIGRKDNEKKWENYKHIYAFDLVSKKISDEPVYRIDLQNEIFGNNNVEGFSPSAIGIHPKTGELYILEGKEGKLLLMTSDGNPKTLYSLSKNLFSQPEGITFSPEGNLFVSNEGSEKQSGNILELEISQ